jgi:hypothetical protein
MPAGAALGRILLPHRVEVAALGQAEELLAGLPWPFRVERPDELRTELRALAARLERAADAPAP